ncbi:MAG: solute-binding protein [Armatimonadetes bacterium]|nr:solute-binding protein [Armatimonadota bacterium]
MVKLLGLGALAVLLLGGCRPGTVSIKVRGGPSLNGLFAELSQAFEAENPSLRVDGDFTCPPCILLQPGNRPPMFDLFVALGDQEIEFLQAQPNGLAFGEQRTLGHTSLVLVTSARTDPPIRTLADLHREGLGQIGLGDPEQTSVGYYARKALRKAGLWGELKPHFLYARSGCELLKWLALGRDLDAAFVYGICTREVGGGLRSVVDLPEGSTEPIPVILTAVQGSRRPAEARRFMDFCASPAVADILRRYLVEPVKQP